MHARDCTDTWTPTATTTDWAYANNWSARRPPGQEDRACIPDGALVTANGVEAAVGSLVVEGTLSLDQRTRLELTDAGRPSSFEVLVLKNATLGGRSPMTVTGTFSWGNGGVLEGPGLMRLARRSNTTFDAGDGGKGVLRRRMLAQGDFDLAAGALYLTADMTNTGHVHGTFESPNGYPAGLLDGNGKPIKITGNVPNFSPGSPGRVPSSPPPTP